MGERDKTMLGFDEKVYYIDSKKENAALLVERRLASLLRRCPKPRATPVFLCIGSDRVTGDSLGPIIGSRLKEAFRDSLPVYGTLEVPVHALNLSSVLEAIRARHPEEPLIAIDASLGVPEHLGYITLGQGSLTPGAGVQKTLESTGDIFITGIVGASGRYAHLTLQTARLSSVLPVAGRISAGILSLFDTTRSEMPLPGCKRLRHPGRICAEELLPDRIPHIHRGFRSSLPW